MGVEVAVSVDQPEPKPPVLVPSLAPLMSALLRKGVLTPADLTEPETVTLGVETEVRSMKDRAAAEAAKPLPTAQGVARAVAGPA
jgi:hypothetical protein